MSDLEETPAAPSSDRKTVEDWARVRGLQPWQFAAAKMLMRWPEGREVTEDEFNQAVNDALNTRHG